MNILIACEKSGTVREAIVQRTHHYVMSVDLLPSDIPGNHYTGDVFDAVVLRSWDMMIAFPPCTYICKTQMWRCHRYPERMVKQNKAIQFVSRLMNLPIPMIAIENPSGALTGKFRPPDQIIHPWWFGDPYAKDVCFWLKNIAPLIATCYSTLRKPISNHVNGRMSQARKSEIKSNWKYFPGMTKAIVNQWM